MSGKEVLGNGVNGWSDLEWAIGEKVCMKGA
jgi:hypothetical protein